MVMKYKTPGVTFLIGLLAIFSACNKPGNMVSNNNNTNNNNNTGGDTTVTKPDTFYFGADLSYTNQILDHGGVYKDSGMVETPYEIFKHHGANLVRFRLWYDPEWTETVYGSAGTQMYSDLTDVEKSIRLSKAQGLSVLLDFHYSDIWADAGTQIPPAAWDSIMSMNVLEDSVYAYTYRTLATLDSLGLMPDMVQLGNEINCGLFYTNDPVNFPSCDACNGQWTQLGDVLNSAIKAVRDVSASSSVQPKIILHVADPADVGWWFTNITQLAHVSDFDIIGISYYPLLHTTVPFNQIQDSIAAFRTRYNKQVMIVETAYPWTTAGDDSYANFMGSQTPVTGYPYTPEGQFDIMRDLTQQVISGGGEGVIYWEPDWITSQMKDQWGTGSSFENCTFFDFNGNTIQGINFMTYNYNLEVMK
jgi:arabinogalactan endo-1,4-beta-galactosidase